VVETAESVLWSDQGAQARSYLARRGLSEETIRKARLGYCPEDRWVQGIFPDQEVWVPGGIVISWLDGPDVTLINIRRPEGQPKYLAVKGSHRGGIYPSRSGIVRGKPLVIVEGEFDALLLGQELDGLSSVVTLGSASDRPKPTVLNAMLKASPWIIASDADDAGERSAENWLALSDRSVRASPPKEHGKDWTDSYQNGLDLRAWWLQVLERLARESSPPPMPEAHRLLPPPATIDNLSEGFSEVEGFIVQEPTPWPWRESLAWWSVEWRLRWGGLANAYIAAGIPWREAEERAASEVAAERAEAGDGPPPAFDYDPEAKFFRGWLRDLIENGQAARFLTKDQFSRAETLVDRESSDGEAMRSLVHDVKTCYWEDRYRTLGLPNPADASRRWRCLNSYCLTKGRWWMSRYGVVRCMNCQPPGFSWLIIEEGDAAKVPIVERERSSQAIGYPRSIPVSTIRP